MAWSFVLAEKSGASGATFPGLGNQLRIFFGDSHQTCRSAAILFYSPQKRSAKSDLNAGEIEARGDVHVRPFPRTIAQMRSKIKVAGYPRLALITNGAKRKVKERFMPFHAFKSNTVI